MLILFIYTCWCKLTNVTPGIECFAAGYWCDLKQMWIKSVKNKAAERQHLQSSLKTTYTNEKTWMQWSPSLYLHVCMHGTDELAWLATFSFSDYFMQTGIYFWKVTRRAHAMLCTNATVQSLRGQLRSLKCGKTPIYSTERGKESLLDIEI